MKKNNVKYLVISIFIPIICLFALVGCGAMGGGSSGSTENCKHITQVVLASDATCEHDGFERHYKCTFCGKLFLDKEATKEITKDDVRIPKSHWLNHLDAKEATCTAEGNIDCWQCTVCRGYFGDDKGEEALDRSEAVLAKLPHDYRDFDRIPPTCTVRGREPGKRCSVCDESISGSNWIPVIDHDYDANDICTMCHYSRYSMGLQYETIYGTVDGEGAAVAYKVTGVDLKAERKVYIPAKYEGLPVTEIESQAFDKNKFITGVKIPASVETIGLYAFEECPKLAFAEFEEGSAIAEIPGSCFFKCPALETVNIPDTVKKIGHAAFRECKLLDVSSLPEALEDVGGFAFYQCNNVGDIIVPATVARIGENAFSDCKYAVLRCDANMPSDYHSDMAKNVPVVWNRKTNEVTSNGYIYATVCGVRYQLSGGIATVLGYRRTDAVAVTELNIPVKVSYGGAQYAVRYIDDIDTPFEYCKNITKISFEKGVAINSFQRYMLTGCDSLEELVLPFAGSNLGQSSDNDYNILAYLFARQPAPGWYNVRSMYGATGGYLSCYAPNTFKKITVQGGRINRGCFSDYKYLETVILEDVTYTSDGIFDCDSNLKSITVPGGKRLNELFATQNFQNSYIISTELKKYYIPNSLENIYITGGNVVTSMFEGFSKVKSIEVPSAVTEIGNKAFKGCERLQEITIPAGVTNIGADAFDGCTGLAGAYTASIAAWFGIKFNSATSNPLYYAHALYVNGEKLTDIALPSGITELPAYVYAGFDGGEDLELPSGITKINSGALYGCTSLKSISVPSSMQEIARGAFSGCDAIEELELPFIGTKSDGTGDRRLKEVFVTMPQSLKKVTVTGTALYYGAFQDCGYLTEINLASGTTSIPDYAFDGCASLKSITLPGNIESIGNYAFRNSGIINFVMPGNVTSVGVYAFVGCNSLKTFTTHFVGSSSENSTADANTLFGYYFGRNTSSHSSNTAQYYAANSNAAYTNVPETLEKITVTGGKIFYGTFSGMKNVCEIALESGVTRIDKSIVKDCDSLHTVRVEMSQPDEKTDSQAFDGCLTAIAYFTGSGTQTYNIPAVYSCDSNGTASDGRRYARVDGITYGFTTGGEKVAKVYRQPKNIESCDIPDKVTYDGFEYTVTEVMAEAFKNCSLLTEVSIPDTVTAMGTSLFAGCTNITSAHLPFIGTSDTDGTTFKALWGIGASDYNTYKLAELTVDRGVIVADAFKDCSKFVKISVNNASSVGSKAFYNCNDLTELSILGDVSSIAEGALARCSSLVKLTLPFAGKTANPGSADEAVFSYVFGKNSTTNTSAKLYDVYQYYGEGIENMYRSLLPRSLRQVTIAGGKLLRGAFYGVQYVDTVTLGSGIDTIGDYAFANCRDLDATITDSITTIGAHAYDEAKNSKALTLTNVTSIGEYAFRNNKFTVFTLPSMITAIPAGMLKGCTDLTTINGLSAVTAIGAEAFMGCTALKQFVLPAGVTAISEYMLANCTGITSFTVPTNVTSIGNYAFSGSGLTSFDLPANITKVSVGLFKDCTDLASVTLHAGLTEIQVEAFANTALTSVTVPAGVESIGKSAFEDCAQLSQVTLPSSGLTAIREAAFKNCGALTAITLPADLITLQKSAFEATGLVTVALPVGIIDIPDSAFSGCKSLTTVTSYAKKVGVSAFSECTKLASCTLGSDHIQIGGSAFNQCYALKNFDFSKVTSLSTGAFQYSGITSGVTSETILVLGVVTVPSNAFRGCTGLTGVSLPDATTVGDYAFSGCSNLTSLNFGNTPNNIQKIGEGAFKDCKLADVYLGTSLEEIGKYAFASQKGGVFDLHITVPATTGSNTRYKWQNVGTNSTYETSSLNGNALSQGLGDYAWKRKLVTG